MIRQPQYIITTLPNRHNLQTFLLSIFWVAVMFSAVSPKANAQLSEDTSVATSSDLKIASIEQSYDQQIIQILSNYFDRTKFYVDVNIITEVVDETYTTRQNKVKQQRSNDITMPGLPFLPDENRQGNQVNQTPETVVNERTVPSLRLKNLNINIYADSSFTSEELEFMRKMAGIAAKTDESRGDNVTISQVSMPSFSSSSGPPLSSSETSKGDSSSNFADIFASLNQYLPGIILLLVVGLLIFVSRLNNKSKTSEGFTNLRQRDSYSDFDTPVQDSKMTGPSEKDDKAGSAFDRLIEKFLSQPKEISLLFEAWIDEDRTAGINRAAKVISTVDKDLIKSLKHVLNQDHYSAIVEAAESMPAMSLEEKKEVAQEFNSILQSDDTNTATNKNKQLPLFKFLNHISDEQTLSLIKSEDSQTAALIVNYLSQQKAAALLDQLDNGLATDIMLEMTKIQDLSYKKQKEISSQLFDKAMSLLNKRKDEQYDPKSILPVLESLPVTEQRRYIKQLKEKGASVGKFIEDYFITIEQIPDLDNELLKNATRNINTETLLDAVIGLDESVTEKLLSLRPQREQRLIRMELEQISEEDEFDTNYAKSQLMRAIRQTANRFNN